MGQRLMNKQADRTGTALMDDQNSGDAVATAAKVWKSPQVIVGTLGDAETGSAHANDGPSSSAQS